MTSTPTSALPKSTDEVPKFKVVILGKHATITATNAVYHSSMGVIFLSIPCCVYLNRSY